MKIQIKQALHQVMKLALILACAYLLAPNFGLTFSFIFLWRVLRNMKRK